MENKEKVMAEKPNKWKFLMVVVPAILSAVAMVMSTWVLATGAKESSVKSVVNQINNNVIPRLQDLLDDAIKENAELRERVAKLEGLIEGLKVRKERGDTEIKPKSEEKKEKKSESRKFKLKKIPQIQMQQIF